MRNFLLTLFILVTKISYTQTVEWVRTESFPTHFSGYNKVVADPQGNCFALNYWKNKGLYFVKYDKQGVKKWEKTWLGGAVIRSIATDDAGCVYVVVGCGNDSLLIEGTKYGPGDLFLKFQSSGTPMWIKRPTEGYALWFNKKFGSDNTVMTTGAYDWSNNKFNLPNYPENHKMYLGAMDTSGSMLWAKDREGAPMYCPKSNGKDTYINSAMIWPYTLGKGSDTVTIPSMRMFLSKYTANGTRKWAKVTDSWISTPDMPGNVYSLGMAGQLPYMGNTSFITKFDTSGQALWNTKIEVGDWYLMEMVCNKEGDLFLAGGFKNYIDIAGIRQDANGLGLFVAKFDSQGKLLSILTSSGSGQASVRDISIEGSDIWISGEVSGTVEFAGQTITQTNGGVFTAKLLDDDNFVSVPDMGAPATHFVVFPNPSKHQISFKYVNANGENVTMVVQDVAGRTLLYKDFGKEKNLEETFELRGLARGLYIFRLKHGETIETRKIVIE